MQARYLSQALVDSKAILLILKLLNQDTTEILSTSTIQALQLSPTS